MARGGRFGKYGEYKRKLRLRKSSKYKIKIKETKLQKTVALKKK